MFGARAQGVGNEDDPREAAVDRHVPRSTSTAFSGRFERHTDLAKQRGVAHQHGATFNGRTHAAAVHLLEGLGLGDIETNARCHFDNRL